MAPIRIVDVTDRDAFERIPPCADPGFDHRTCDYWEDADRGSKAARLAWLETERPTAAPKPPRPAVQPVPRRSRGVEGRQPVRGRRRGWLRTRSPPMPPRATTTRSRRSAPRARRSTTTPRPSSGCSRAAWAWSGSYAKVLLVDDVAVAYAQFGPLTAYPRAQRVRDLYAQLPDSPLPAVITCIATTATARREGHGLRLVAATCDDLAGRGFAAVEAYPQVGAPPDATSAATPAFWERAGFVMAAADERFPVMRRELV